MRHPTKYFIWNKLSDFVRGSHYNMDASSSGIQLADIQQEEGYYYSRLLDSREKQMQWHRLLIEGDTISESSVRFWIYTSEHPTISYGDKELDLDTLLTDETISEKEKQTILQPYCVRILDNPKDCLLHDVQGRYLWFRIRFVTQSGHSPYITKIKLIFPKNTWLQYLPDIYQENGESASFVERYLGMFQSLYQDMTEAIRNVPQYLDADVVTGPFLEWLTSWISVEDSYLWNEEQLRYLLQHGIELYHKRGTVQYLEEMVRLYTGRTPFIVEQHELESYLDQSGYAEKLRILYGADSYTFTVIVDCEKQMSNRDYQVLTRIIEQAKPAHMESNIIVLEPYIFLDQHSYLGINSVLGRYGTLILDGQSSIPFAALTEPES